MELAKSLGLSRLIIVWILCCLGFGAGLAEQQWSTPCPIHREVVEVSSHGGIVESFPHVWHQQLTSLANQAIHLVLHMWLCEKKRNEIPRMNGLG
jgi:hypothetical protein